MTISKAPNSRFAFYWNEQRGRCALMITDACRMHGGQMVERPATISAKRQIPAQPTWDHIYPKPRTPEQERIQVLACAACNNKRGNATPTAQYMARGEDLTARWLALEAVRLCPKQKRRDERQAIAAAAPLLSRAERNAESQAAAALAIAERMKNQGRKADSMQLTAKAASILAAVRGKPPERK